MSSIILCAAFLQAALMASEPAAADKPEVAAAQPAAAKAAEADEKKTDAEEDESYTEAHRITLKTGKPLVVMVGADWCGPCQNMRRTILPRVREHGLFRKVAFAHVNVDKEKDLAKEIVGGVGAVPQLIMFRKTKDGWTRSKMIGSHSVEEVEKFINDGLAMDADEHQADARATEETSTTSTEDLPDADRRHG
jgi:thioredoxin-like negative regulator of GroEL